jgi:hypothetical protein
MSQRKTTVAQIRGGGGYEVALLGGAFGNEHPYYLDELSRAQAEELAAAWESWGGVHGVLVVGEEPAAILSPIIQDPVTAPSPLDALPPLPCDHCGVLTAQRDLWRPNAFDRLGLPGLGMGYYCPTCFPRQSPRPWPDDLEELRRFGPTVERRET